jgi:hypothetical protein
MIDRSALLQIQWAALDSFPSFVEGGGRLVFVKSLHISQF